MILIVTFHFADYHVVAKNANLTLAVIVFIVIFHLYISTRCSGQNHIMSTHIQEVCLLTCNCRSSHHNPVDNWPWHCHTCRYDLCDNCIGAMPKVKTGEEAPYLAKT